MYVLQAALNGLMELLSAEVLRTGFEQIQWQQSLEVWDEIAQYACKVFVFHNIYIRSKHSYQQTAGYPEKPVNALVDNVKQLYLRAQTGFKDSDLLW